MERHARQRATQPRSPTTAAARSDPTHSQPAVLPSFLPAFPPGVVLGQEARSVAIRASHGWGRASRDDPDLTGKQVGIACGRGWPAGSGREKASGSVPGETSTIVSRTNGLRRAETLAGEEELPPSETQDTGPRRWMIFAHRSIVMGV